MSRLHLIFIFVLMTSLPAGNANAQPEKSPPVEKTGNPLVTTLWFSHLYAMPQSLTPARDRQLKNVLTTVLQGNTKGLIWDDVDNHFEKSAFLQLADKDGKIEVAKMEQLLSEKTRHREALFPKIRQHADLLTTQFDLIEAGHRESAEKLTAWIVKNYQADKPLEIDVICTGNSRRSVLGATLGNSAATYHGMPNIRFYSGGTTPGGAFNPRAVASLRKIGVEAEPSAKEAARGKAGDANPIYQVRWGKGLETEEFSKLYADERNPRQGFAAILVCGEADESSPSVRGADPRISLPHVVPKVFDGSSFEAAKYAKRRDDIGRFMLSVLMQASRRLSASQ